MQGMLWECHVFSSLFYQISEGLLQDIDAGARPFCDAVPQRDCAALCRASDDPDKVVMQDENPVKYT
jgi:hypothetical protein